MSFNLKLGEGGGGVEPSLLLLLWIPWMLISEVGGIRVDLYLNKDKFGEFLRMDISEKGCTNVPLNWDNQAYSLETHGSCVKFYDLPYCRGKYVALQPYHTTFQDNLETLGFKHLISSASPCGPKVPTGRYYILNGADGSLLTIEQKNGTVVARTKPFKPFITKNQQFQIDKISLADYEIIPRVHEDLNPVTYDMSLSTKQYPVRRTWKIESVYRGKYLIKNEWNNKCLYKTDIGRVEEHDCVPWSPNQEWMFKSIKIQPFFPSKEQLSKNPAIKPDAQLPFDPQEEVNPFAPGGLPHPPRPAPGQPLEAPPVKYLKNQQKNKKKKEKDDSEEDEENDDSEEDEEDEEDVPNKASQISKPHTRPNPIVLNPREPFPPVQPHPIYPKGTQFLPPIGPDGKPDFSKPPVPVVRHPGQQPFPREPVVTDPKKPVWPPTLFGSFGPTPPTTTKATPVNTKKKNSEEEEEEDGEEEETEKDDADEEAEDKEEDEREEEGDENEVDREEEGEERGSLERGRGQSSERRQGQSFERDQGQSYERGDGEEQEEEEDE